MVVATKIHQEIEGHPIVLHQEVPPRKEDHRAGRLRIGRETINWKEIELLQVEITKTRILLPLGLEQQVEIEI